MTGRLLLSRAARPRRRLGGRKLSSHAAPRSLLVREWSSSEGEISHLIGGGPDRSFHPDTAVLLAALQNRPIEKFVVSRGWDPIGF